MLLCSIIRGMMVYMEGPLLPVKIPYSSFFVLIFLSIVLSCGQNTGKTDFNGGGTTAGHLTIQKAEDGIWFEHNGLPYPNGETGTEVMSLSGTWRFLEDPENKGLTQGWEERDRDISWWRTTPVPGVWNAVFQDLFHYEGLGWYAVDVTTPEPPARPVLSFGAVFLTCDVYVNGERVGGHESGYTPFWVDASGAWLAGRNRIVLRVDNRVTSKTIPVDTLTKPGSHGWWPYGGILREVELHDWPRVLAFRLDARYELNPDLGSALLGFRFGIHGLGSGGETVTAEMELFDPQGVKVMEGRSGPVQVPGGEAIHLKAFGELHPVRLWDVNTPEVYTAKVRLRDTQGNVIHTAGHKTGFRLFEIRHGDFFLNGRRHVLRGINRHDDVPDRGSALSDADVERDLDLIRELGADHTRPGHYPVHPGILAGCRDRGITVTEEIPVYQLAFQQFHDPDLIATARQQLIEMIERDRNNPAVILWSVSNETWTFLTDGQYFASLQVDTAREWDPARPVTAALLNSACFVPDGAVELLDVVSLNEYFGWYIGRDEDVPNCLAFLQCLYADKPIILSEFGAGAAIGRHIDPEAVGREPLDNHSYSEEFQAWLLSSHLEAADRAGIDGTMPWILADFHMEWNPTTGKPHPVEWTNLKGLASYDRTPKLSFETVRSFYTDPDFLADR